MKTAVENTDTAQVRSTTSSQAFETGQATILATPQMFDMLSTKLYPVPLEAAIREVMKNALDAHIEAGVERPFEIAVPVSGDLNFICRDYGTGLSHEAMMTLFLTYGSSTKQHTNELAGGFGIGSKAPFAYSNQFTVISRHQGVKRSYVFYREPGQAPKLMGIPDATPCDDSGLEVVFPVRETDKWIAYNYVSEFLDSFPPGSFKTIGTLPTGSNYVKLYENQYGVMFLPEGAETNNYTRLNAASGRGYHAKARVWCGPVFYDADYKAFPDSIERIRLHQDWLRFKAPIGSVTIAPSRDQLVVDDQTKETLTDVSTKFLETLADEPDLTPEIMFAIRLLTTGVSRSPISDVQHGNQSFSDPVLQRMWERVRDKISKSLIKLHYSNAFLTQDIKDRKSQPKPMEVTLFDPNETSFIIDDLPPKGIRRTWLRLKKYQHGFRRYVVIIDDRDDFDEDPSYDIYRMSDMPVPEDNLVRGSIPKRSLSEVQWRCFTTDMSSIGEWTTRQYYLRGDTPRGSFIYCPLKSHECVNPRHHDLVRMLYPGLKVWGVTQTDAKLMQHYPEATSLEDWLNDFIANYDVAAANAYRVYSSLLRDYREVIECLDHANLSIPGCSSGCPPMFNIYEAFGPQDTDISAADVVLEFMKNNPVLVDTINNGIHRSSIQRLIQTPL